MFCLDACAGRYLGRLAGAALTEALASSKPCNFERTREPPAWFRLADLNGQQLSQQVKSVYPYSRVYKVPESCETPPRRAWPSS
jgi:hypothetical protein